MAVQLCDATVTRACIAAAGRLRGVRARRLEPEQVVRALLGGAGPIVGVEEPAASPVAGAVVAPTLVTFSSPPPMDLREAAWETWPEVIRRQSSWADYVFTKQPLFDPARPLVLAAPGGGGDDAYLDHAASLGTGAPFVCLRGDAASFAAASGGTVVGDAAPGPEAAHAAAGAACDALNLHGDFAQLLGPRGGRATLGVAGGRATPDLVDALVALQTRLAPADDGDDVDARVRDALGSEGALLRSCAVFDCALAGALFPLHAVGTTLGAARPAAPPKDTTL